jgi:hypothetical protein
MANRSGPRYTVVNTSTAQYPADGTAYVAPLLHTRESFEIEYRITRLNTTTGAIEPATGLANVAARWATTPTGAAIFTATTLTERGSTGIYSGVIARDTLATNLEAYAGQSLYLILTVTGTLENVWTAYTVVAHRLEA